LQEVFVRIIKQKDATIIAVCDDNLLGNTFREGKLKLEVKESFYRGDHSSLEDAMRAVDGADIANLVGQKTISAAVSNGYADPRAVITIAGVPHVQIVRLGRSRSKLLR